MEYGSRGKAGGQAAGSDVPEPWRTVIGFRKAGSEENEKNCGTNYVCASGSGADGGVDSNGLCAEMRFPPLPSGQIL